MTPPARKETIMALYTALLYYPADSYWTTPEEEKFSAGYNDFAAAAAAAGVLRGGEALHPLDTATTITVADGLGGDVMVTDGPYAEAKEVLGGFFLLEAADLDEASKWAAQIPAAWSGKVELRPVVPMGGPRPRADA
jgi:hypothetical protein